MFVITISILASLSMAQIEWVGMPFAASNARNVSATNGETILKSRSGPRRAQFNYTKIESKIILAPAFVSVRLQNARNTTFDLELQKKFDMINQSCSCYKIDVGDIQKKVRKTNHTLESDLSYQIVFRETNVTVPREWASGLFGIVVHTGNFTLTAPAVNAVLRMDLGRREHIQNQLISVPDPVTMFEEPSVTTVKYTSGLNVNAASDSFGRVIFTTVSALAFALLL
jgi:hypothetical protein